MAKRRHGDPYFKLSVHIGRHPKTIRVYWDDAMLATYTRLGVALVIHFAQLSDDQMVVSGTELKDIANTGQVGGAVQRMKRLAEISPVEFLDPSCAQDAAKVRSGCRQVVAKVSSRRAKIWVLGLPNFAKRQFNRHDELPAMPPSESESEATTEVREEIHSGTPPRRPVETVRPEGKTRTKKPVGLEALKIAESLRHWIRKTHPGAKTPQDLTTWARTADRMLRIDGRKLDQVLAAMEWLFTKNAESDTPFMVLSMKALRAKYDRMRAQATKEAKPKGPKHGKRETARDAGQRILAEYDATH